MFGKESFTWIVLKTVLCLALDPRNFMRHIGVRGASRHDRRVRCAFEAIYDILRKTPTYMDLGSCAGLPVEALKPLGLPCKCVSDLIWLDRGGAYPSELWPGEKGWEHTVLFVGEAF